MPKPISEILVNTLIFIQQFIADNGQSPTLKEIAKHFNIQPPSAFNQLKRLEEAGYIKRFPGQWRSIQILDVPSVMPQVKEFIKVPVVGRVAAGTSVLAEENRVGYLQVDSTLGRKGNALFALKVRGNSMINADIKPGDFVIARQQPVANSGDIVIAVKGNEGFVKRLRLIAGQIELVSENPNYKPIQIKRGDEFHIAGKVVSVYRGPEPIQE